MDYTVHGILQARILEWVAIPVFRGSSQPRDQTQVYRIASGFFTTWTTREALKSWGIHHFSTLSWKVKVAQLCLTLCNYTVHGILQARILEWVAFPFSRGSSQPRDQTQVSHIAGGLFTSWATREAIVTSKTQQINSSLICLLSIVTGQCFQLFSLILFSSENNVVSS